VNSRSHILIVDDDLSNVELIGSILGSLYDISFACDGQEGLSLANREAIDLILLDVMMPGINGFEACRQLKANSATRDIPVIFLTSLESAVDEERGLSLGAEDFIHKPVSPPVMLARVRNHLLLANTRLELKRYIDQLELLVEKRTEEIGFRDRQLIATQSATIAAFCSLAEARDNETGNHIRRTQRYVQVLAQALSTHPRFRQVLDDETIRLLFETAPLHDIGKVSIPDAILLKPGKLTAQEWAIMQRHCVAGRDAIVAAANKLTDGSNDYLKYAAEIAYCHHERWDGSGYPNALKGDNIPISARLMAVADVYDALITKRVYKEAYSHEESIQIMTLERGAHFDPDVLDAMLSISDTFKTIACRYQDSIDELSP
jgi:putative two-component system response regulator